MQKWLSGEMVRFMAERRIENPTDIQKNLTDQGRFREDLSSEKDIFERLVCIFLHTNKTT